jgi:hypothetical protein
LPAGIDFWRSPGTWAPKTMDLGAKFWGHLAPRSSNASRVLPWVFSTLGDLGAIFQRDWSTVQQIVSFQMPPKCPTTAAVLGCGGSFCTASGRFSNFCLTPYLRFVVLPPCRRRPPGSYPSPRWPSSKRDGSQAVCSHGRPESAADRIGLHPSSLTTLATAP